MQQENEKILKNFSTPKQFGAWLQEKRHEQQLSLREMATRCSWSSVADGGVSASYISKLERGFAGAISCNILLLIKDTLVVSYAEMLEHLPERNYRRFSHFLRRQRTERLASLDGTDKDEEWRAFLERADGVSRKVIEPLLWDLVNRDIIGCELIPYTWREDFWAGLSDITDMGDCMSNLADIFDGLKGSTDRVAHAVRAAIEDALGNDYIELRRKKRIAFEKKFQKSFKKECEKRSKG